MEGIEKVEEAEEKGELADRAKAASSAMQSALAVGLFLAAVCTVALVATKWF